MAKYPLECPFCGRYFDPPQMRSTEFGEILHGRCDCKAIYVLDRTSRNVGAAYMEALLLTRGGWDIEQMDPDRDYDVIHCDYDISGHKSLAIKARDGVKGKLVFVRPRTAANDITASMTDQKTVTQDNEAPVEGETLSLKKAMPKQQVRKCLETKSYNEIADAVAHDKRVISFLISFSYDRDDVITWRAAEAMGLAAGQLSHRRLDVVRDTIRRLLWALREESGGIGWTAPEMLGEIIRNNPDEFKDIIPILWSFYDEEVFTPGVLWAMGRIAEVRPDLVQFIRDSLSSLMDEGNAEVKGYTLRLMKLLGKEISNQIKGSLMHDKGMLRWYENGELSQRALGELAASCFGDSPNNNKK